MPKMALAFENDTVNMLFPYQLSIYPFEGQEVVIGLPDLYKNLCWKLPVTGYFAKRLKAFGRSRSSFPSVFKQVYTLPGL